MYEIAQAPNYLFTIPVLIVASWILAELVRRRRLARLGDSKLLVPGVNILTRTLRVCALAAAAACAIFIIILSRTASASDQPRPRSLGILLDAELSERSAKGEASVVEEIESHLEAIVRWSVDTSFTLIQSGNPPNRLVPLTVDAPGFLMLASDAINAGPGGSPASLVENLTALANAANPSVPGSITHLLVITPRAPENLALLQQAVAGAKLPIRILSLENPRDTDSTRSSTRAKPLNLKLSPAGLQDFLSERASGVKENRGSAPSVSPTQLSASMAFVLLLVEYAAAGLSRRVPRRSVSAAMVGILWLALGPHYFLRAEQRGALVDISALSPEISVVTEVRPSSPFVGQQFTVTYALRATRNPIAVDVEPQQFNGFWMENITFEESERSRIRIVKGRATREFVLRQVIVHPLLDGAVELPPLAVKIRMKPSADGNPEDWDLQGKSKGVTLEVRSAPDHPKFASLALSGTIQGSMQVERRAAFAEIQLSLMGTANLSLFNPQDWLRCRNGVLLSSRLIAAESEIRKSGTGEESRTWITHHRRWSIRVLPEGTLPPQVENLTIPVLQPESGKWTTVIIAGNIEQSASSDRADSEHPSPSPTAKPEDGPPGWQPVARLGLFAGLVLIALILLIRRIGPVGVPDRAHNVHLSLALLQKQHRNSPRAFIETAHRVLVRYAEEKQLIPIIGREESPFDRCWNLVERTRFVDENPPADNLVEILESIQKLVRPSS